MAVVTITYYRCDRCSKSSTPEESEVHGYTHLRYWGKRESSEAPKVVGSAFGD